MTHPDTFIFHGYEEDSKQGAVSFFYELMSRGDHWKFTEIVRFPKDVYAETTLTSAERKNYLDALSLMLGLSYYKLRCPRSIEVRHTSLSQSQATFWNTVYTKGLGEFYYRNAIDFHGLVQFPFVAKAKEVFVRKPMADRTLVLLGGGKDSIVGAELLKKGNKPYTLFIVNEHPIRTQVAELLGGPVVSVTRIIDPQLASRNASGTVYNGHIPVSAVLACISMYGAALTGHRFVMTSNEDSANFGNVSYGGEYINHQWSKSFEFETLFRRYCSDYITKDISYFSLLRPLTEIHIAKLFAGYPQYFSVFSSCNKNFTTSSVQNQRWCGQCPKCVFVFLLLGAFIQKKTLVSIFGKNLFADKKLVNLFEEVLGFAGIKPFECVGTPEEAQYALARLWQQGKYAKDVVMKEITALHPRQINAALDQEKMLFALRPAHAVPADFFRLLT